MMKSLAIAVGFVTFGGTAALSQGVPIEDEVPIEAPVPAVQADDVISETTTAPRELLGPFQDWSVDVGVNQDCWAVITPKSSTYKRNGKTIGDVLRGDTQLTVALRPEGFEVAYMSGFPMDVGDPAIANVRQSKFTMITHERNAWPDHDDDASFIAEMRAAGTLWITSQSQRGTTVIDEFSMMGLSKALEVLTESCGSQG